MRRVSAPSDRLALIGVGASSLVAELLECEYHNIDAVDLSGPALNQLRQRLLDSGVDSRVDSGVDTVGVRFVEADVREVVFDGPIDLWHDRATLHFLTVPIDQAKYALRAAQAVRPGGHLVIATFSLNGPEQCSGLPVVRHSVDSLARLFGDSFEQIESFQDEHATPWGANQAFLTTVFRRK